VAVPPAPDAYFTASTSAECETSVLDGNDAYTGSDARLATGFPCGTPCRGNLTEVRSCFRKECPVGSDNSARHVIGFIYSDNEGQQMWRVTRRA
jgi:hypothetical protein